MTAPAAPTEQLAVLKRQVRKKRPQPVATPAASQPVASVAVDLPLAHLDRPFDYAVLEPMADSAVPGCRVKVRFAGRDVDGYLLERSDHTEHLGQLTALRRVVSSEPVLTPEVATIARVVADRYAGTLSDVLRLAIPPRSAKVEAELPRATSPPLDVPLDALGSAWAAEPPGVALLRRLSEGQSPRAVWTATPGDDWPMQLATAAVAARASGRGSIVCLPDVRDVARVDAALTSLFGGRSAHVVLTADLGLAVRYRAFLAVLRAQVPIVVGTRAAAFAPVANLGLVVMWDDGDDLFAEPRAPYPHAREVLLVRAHLQRTAVVLGSFARSVASAQLVDAGWAALFAGARERVRAAAPLVATAGDDDFELARDPAAGAARMPHRVFDVVRRGLERGPVLVQTPRYGYHPALVCASCRSVARCDTCSGGLERRAADSPPTCRWCARPMPHWRCGVCGSSSFRTPIVGSLRTAQEWGRSFPGVPVLTSGGDAVLEAVPPEPAVVISTPGAEPRPPPAGYAAAVLLDTWLTLARAEVWAGEEAVRRWMNASALVRSASDGGRVVAVGMASTRELQALVRWDPDGYAMRELADRRSARLPPAARVATLTARPAELAEALDQLSLPSCAEVAGPVELSPELSRLVVRAPRQRGRQLTRALQRLQSARSARKLPVIRVQVDPGELA